METILWLITKFKYRKKAFVGYKARIKNCDIAGNFRIFSKAKVIDCYIGKNSHVANNARVRNAYLGSNVGIAENALVGVYNRKNKRTVIENDVMIGAGAIIMEGVKIRKGAWIGAGCVIRSNVSAFSVMALPEPIKLRTRPQNEDGQKMG